MIVIVGVLSVSALPKFFSVLSFSTPFFVTESLNSLRYAQKVAIGMGCDVEVSSASNTLTLRLRQNCSTGTFSVDLRDPSSGASSYVKQAPSGVSISAPNFPIYFDPLGRAHRSSGAILDTDMVVASRTLRVIGETGYVYEP